MKKADRKKTRLEILNLEDSTMDAELIHKYLCEKAEHEIQMSVVSKEDEFVSAITKKKYDLILADFGLPDFNGFEALEHVKSICPNTPFISVSGTIGEETAVELLKQLYGVQFFPVEISCHTRLLKKRIIGLRR